MEICSFKIAALILAGLLISILPACWTGQGDKSSGKPLSSTLKQDALYKIVPAQNYTPESQDDCIKLMPLDVESGFIHVSFGRQAEKVLQKFFKNSKDIILLELDPQVLQQQGLEIRKEQNKPGGDFFPHIYGVQNIPAKAILSVIKVAEKTDGSWSEIN